MTGPPRSDRWPWILAAAAGVAAFAGMLAALLGVVIPGNRDDAVVSAPSTAYTTPPAAAVTLIHETLNDIGARCDPRTDAGDRERLNRDVDVILAFAARYPNAEFPVDDETGHTLSLLLAARDDLRRCAPAAADRITAALPEQFRPTPASDTTSGPP